jgi:AcrR family transcriptional regulator
MARQAERSEATRRAVLEAATRRFGEAGFDAVTVDEIAAAAGVAKGAVYHHFASKEALFEAVFERTSAELAERIRGQLRGRQALDALAEGSRLYFEGCAEPATGRILLKDGPAVLGWERWREIDTRYFLAMLPAALERAMTEGSIARQPVEALARMLAGALTEAAVACAAADDPAAAGRGYVDVLQHLLDGLRIHQKD